MRRRGRGMAVMHYPIGFTSYANPSAAVVRVERDGTAVVLTGATDVGQGSSTVLAQIAAEALGIPYEDVTVVTGDTLICPYDAGSVASRVTYIAGNAVLRAAEAARRELLAAAAARLGVAVEGLVSEGGVIFLRGFPERRLTVREAAAEAFLVHGHPPMGVGHFNPATTSLDPETGHGKPYDTYVYATQIVDVEVDTETGEVTVLRVVAVHDLGRAVNPLLVEGQVRGGVAMGVGYALTEELVVREGRVLNPDLTDYILPTALDIPEIVVDLVEVPDAGGPFGAKGVAEPALLPTAPAIVNAIRDAVGVTVRDLPVTPEKVLRALAAKGEPEMLRQGGDGTSSRWRMGAVRARDRRRRWR
jgi:CO/xanthine dehydrogenase Mo-binding subunit